MSIWRMLLLWCLALALPVQGWAAAARLHCTSAGVHGAAVLQAPAHAGEGAGAHDRGSHDCAGAAHDTAAAGGDDAPDLHAAHSCSACAACSPAVGLPTPGVPLPVAPCGHPADARFEAPAPSHVPATPERPPRD